MIKCQSFRVGLILINRKKKKRRRTDAQKKSIFAQTPYREKEGKGGPTPLTLNRVGIKIYIYITVLSARSISRTTCRTSIRK